MNKKSFIVGVVLGSLSTFIVAFTIMILSNVLFFKFADSNYDLPSGIIRKSNPLSNVIHYEDEKTGKLLYIDTGCRKENGEHCENPSEFEILGDNLRKITFQFSKPIYNEDCKPFTLYKIVQDYKIVRKNNKVELIMELK